MTVESRECACQSHAAGRWLVSTAHREVRLVGRTEQWVPVGTLHARRIGSLVTACGEQAEYWTNFYELPFVPGAVGTCRECVRVLSRRRPGVSGLRATG